MLAGLTLVIPSIMLGADRGDAKTVDQVGQNQLGRTLENHEILTVSGKLFGEVCKALSQETITLWPQTHQITPGSGAGHEVNAQQRLGVLDVGKGWIVIDAEVVLKPVQQTHVGQIS